MTEDLSTSDAPLDRPLSARRDGAMRSRRSCPGGSPLRLSQRQAAGVLGISQSTYARIKRAKRRPARARQGHQRPHRDLV